MKSSPSSSGDPYSDAPKNPVGILIDEQPAQKPSFNERPDDAAPVSPFTSRFGSNFEFRPATLPLDSRLHQRKVFGQTGVYAALAAIALLGGAWIELRPLTTVTATAEALLPYRGAEISAGPGTASPSNDSALPLTGQTAASAFSQFQATAPTAAAAISRVDAAAQSAVQRDSAAWALAAQSSAGSSAVAQSAAQPALDSMPLARVVRLGDDNPLRTHTVYHVNHQRLPLALAWLAACMVAAALYGVSKSKRRLQFAFRAPNHSAKFSAEDAPRIEDLPHMAVVRLARDVSQSTGLSSTFLSDHDANLSGESMRPVLSSASEKLWINFASRADLASAMTAAAAAATEAAAQSGDAAQAAGTSLARYDDAAQAVLEQAEAALALNSNTEILFTRLTRDARGSRAAMLAIARLLARRGKHVVLIDLDFAAPPEAQAELGLPGEFPGAAEILSRRAKIDDCLLTDDDYPALTAISSSLEGTEISHEQAARLLQSAEMLDLLDELREGNHLVLIHGPAAEDAARSLGSRADAALLVVGQQPTEREHRALPDALAEMSAVQANIVGRIEFDSQIA